MHRQALAAIAFGLALSACGKDIENPDFPTSLSCAIDKANCKPSEKPSSVRPLKP